MRGKGISRHRVELHRGITPACAGKRVGFSLEPLDRKDHPRVCGEKEAFSPAEIRYWGSPPRMRGKGKGTRPDPENGGITPAYAGKRAASAREAYFICGSPPRMRGKAYPSDFRFSRYGITPAYAGKSARRQAGPPGPAPPPQMRLGWSPPPCTGRQCRTRKSTHARRARIPAPVHTPAPQ